MKIHFNLWIKENKDDIYNIFSIFLDTIRSLTKNINTNDEEELYISFTRFLYDLS